MEHWKRREQKRRKIVIKQYLANNRKSLFLISTALAKKAL